MARRQRTADEDIGREFVQSLDRGFAIIRTFRPERQSLTIAQVAEEAGVTRAVARRYLLTLRRLGYVAEEEGRFRLTARVLELGFAYLSSMTVPSIAQPVMERLVATVHESCSLSVLDGRDIVYVARVPAKRIMSINLVVGSRLPAHSTSMGKVLLAYAPPELLAHYFAAGPLVALTRKTLVTEPALREALAAVREAGWAEADQETEEGVRSVAAPIFDRSRQVQAAMNLSAHASRVSLKELRQTYLPKLLEATREISRALGAPL